MTTFTEAEVQALILELQHNPPSDRVAAIRHQADIYRTQLDGVTQTADLECKHWQRLDHLVSELVRKSYLPQPWGSAGE